MFLGLVLTGHAFTLLSPIHQVAGAATSGRYFDNIVIVAMENRNYADVMGDGHGDSAAPYIASLLAQGATVPDYHGGYPGCSEACYIALTSGDTYGTSNGDRDIGDANTKTLVNLFEAAGVSWQAYCEGSCGRDGDHFPWIDFVSITTSSARMSHVDTSASTSNLVNAVGSYNFLWYTPEDSNNMHDNDVSSGDSYLSGFIPDILSKTGFTNGRSLLMLWWDEYDPAPFLMLGPTVVHGFISSRNDVEHYTITKLLEENWGTSSLTSNDASQASMSEFFGSSPTPPGQSTNPPADQPSWLPTQVSDLWLILVGVILGSTAGLVVFRVKSRHKNQAKETVQGEDESNAFSQKPSGKGNARRTKSRSTRSISAGKLAIVLFFTTLLMGGALAASLRTPIVNAAVSGRYFDNIVVVAMENQNYADVIGDGHGSSAAPYIASLLSQGATIPNYHGAYCGGGSENSYLALSSGDTWGCPGNGARDLGDSNTKTIVNLFEGGGITWHAYCEASCGRNGDHFPFLDFVSIVNNPERMSHVTESGASTSDLITAVGAATPPNFLWFTPEDNHNMHDNDVPSGDSYLSGFIPGILSKPMFTNGRALLLLWWDEYDPAPILLVGRTVSHGLISARNDIGHYTITKLMEENWGLPSLTSNDSSQQSMSEFFGSSPPPLGQLTASFTYSPNSPLAGQSITFSGSATGGTPGYSFSWTFGDGSSGSGQTVAHAYSGASGYQATLTVHDSVGGIDTASQSIVVLNQPPPEGVLSADFSYSPSNPQTDQPITFTGIASHGRAPYNFAWDFGDASSPGVGSVVQHSYSASGTFTITLTVTDDASSESTATKSVEVSSGSHEISTSFAFKDPSSNDVSSAITWQVWSGSNIVTTASHASLDPLGSYELRIFFQGHLIAKQDFTPQTTVQTTLFMYSHHSTTDGYIAFNSTINSLALDEESNSRLRFTAEGSEGPYTILIAVPGGPTALLKDGSDYPYTFDSGKKVVIVETTSLSRWEVDFGSGTQPPSICPICPPIPSATISNLWLILVGGMIGLTTSLAVLTHRAHNRLQRARRLYPSQVF